MYFTATSTWKHFGVIFHSNKVVQTPALVRLRRATVSTLSHSTFWSEFRAVNHIGFTT